VGKGARNRARRKAGTQATPIVGEPRAVIPAKGGPIAIMNRAHARRRGLRMPREVLRILAAREQACIDRGEKV
jgi:hypothetical protein